MYYDYYYSDEEMYKENFNITDINNLPSCVKELTTNFLKAIVLEMPEDFPTFITQITEREDNTYHNKLDNISDFKNLNIILIDREQAGSEYNVIFQDQDNDLRSIIIYDEIIVGMQRYYLYHEDIKRELIDLINEEFKNLRENKDG